MIGSQSLTTVLAKAIASGNTAQAAFAKSVQREIEARDDRIDELLALIGLKASLPCLIKLQPDSRRIARLIAGRGGLVSRGDIYVAVYGAKPECDQPVPKVIDVQIHRIRKAFAEYAAGFADPVEREANTITILTEHSCGWHIPLLHKSKARELLGLAPVAADSRGVS